MLSPLFPRGLAGQAIHPDPANLTFIKPFIPTAASSQDTITGKGSSMEKIRTG